MYDVLAGQVLQFKLSAQIFDVFGRSIDDYAIHDLLSTTDTDIERQFRLAEKRLGNEGVGNAYVNHYYDEDEVLTLKIHVIIFAANADCMDALNDYAQQKFHDLNDANRRRTVSLPEKSKRSMMTSFRTAISSVSITSVCRRPFAFRMKWKASSIGTICS